MIPQVKEGGCRLRAVADRHVPRILLESGCLAADRDHTGYETSVSTLAVPVTAIWLIPA